MATPVTPDLSAAPAVARFALWPLPDLGGIHPYAQTLEPEPPVVGPSPEEEAFRRGFEGGRAEGVAEANRTLKRAAGLLVAAAEALEAARLGVMRELEDSVYLLALGVARHLVDREVRENPEVVARLIQRGLEAFPVGSRVEIHLNPEDLAVLRSQGGIPAGEGRAGELQWVADPTIERGGCTLQTPHRVVDGRMEQTLKDLYQRMRDD